MSSSANNYDVIIAGAGPAGSSAAIHLANNNLRVLLIEQKNFPRNKLCGEFISPECQAHFQNLGVAHDMTCSRPTSLNETVFYSRQGQHVAVPSSWFGSCSALGLSRAVMDDVLLRRAQHCGVEVLENTRVNEVISDNKRIWGVRTKSDDDDHEYRASVTIDATGRARVLAKKSNQSNGNVSAKSIPKLIAFKAHFRNTRVAEGACEIYFYPGGYGGLSSVENGMSNLCFIIDAESVKRCHSDPEEVLRQLVMKNQRAAYTLESAEVSSEWLSVSWQSFGRQRPSPMPGLLAVGDSAAFIDPFSGSGMLMALESGELAASAIVREWNKSGLNGSFARLASEYTREYQQKFDSRLRLCGLLRRAAFRPRVAELAITICGASERLRSRIARATRGPAVPTIPVNPPRY